MNTHPTYLKLVPSDPRGSLASNGLGRVLPHLDCLDARELGDARNVYRNVRLDLFDRIEHIQSELEDLPAEVSAPLRDVVNGLHDLRSDLQAALSEIDEVMEAE
tara:strand:- start:4309 stop:4620 length:312 start_codon:yes stop_codon:yes gene_type:complete